MKQPVEISKWHTFILPATVIAGMFLLFSLGRSANSAEPVTVEQWLDLGWSYYNSGDKENAYNTFIQTASLFPDNAEAHLVLGEMNLEMGVIGLGRNEILKCLQLDSTSPLASRAHFDLGKSLREEDPARALQHLELAIQIPSSSTLKLETAQQMRFCHLMLGMPFRSQSGPVTLHYADYVLTQSQGDSLASDIESQMYLVESYCTFDLTEQVHFFLYPSERAVRAEIRTSELEFDPAHREYHIVYRPGLSVLESLSVQVIHDLQVEMNRYAGSAWVGSALAVAISSRIAVASRGPEEMSNVTLDCDDAVRALLDTGNFVSIEYLILDEYSREVLPEIRSAELGSLLRWIHDSFATEEFQQVITQPNLELVLGTDMATVQEDWTDHVMNSSSLISDPSSALAWADGLPISPLTEGASRPMEILKEGLRMYLGGQVASGTREVHRAIEIDPGFGLGYYTLGWMACRDGNWERAEKMLTMAVMLLETPEEIAWCHAFLAPIYIRNQQWDLAQASLSTVAGTIKSPDVIRWADELLARINHLRNLQPSEPLDRESPEFGQMREFMTQWNSAANSDRGVESMINPEMDVNRAGQLIDFYASLREAYPNIVFNHAVTAAGLSGSALNIEVLVQAAFQDRTPYVPPEREALIQGGYRRFFQVTLSDSGWRVLDWEDGTMEVASVRLMTLPESGVAGLEEGEILESP